MIRNRPGAGRRSPPGFKALPLRLRSLACGHPVGYGGFNFNRHPLDDGLVDAENIRRHGGSHAPSRSHRRAQASFRRLERISAVRPRQSLTWTLMECPHSDPKQKSDLRPLCASCRHRGSGQETRNKRTRDKEKRQISPLLADRRRPRRRCGMILPVLNEDRLEGFFRPKFRRADFFQAGGVPI
jgi:hypothetical protein